MTERERAQALIQEGRQRRAAGDRKASLDAFEQAALLDPANATAMAECGYEHMHLREIERAREAFERCLALDPADKAALIGLGHTFRHMQDFTSAEQSFRRAIELEPGHADASEGLGYALRSLGRHEEALEALRTAGTANRANTRPKIEAVNLLRDLGRHGEAVALFREIVATEPANKTHLVSLARLLKQTGIAAEAIEVFREAAAIDPADLNLRIELGHLLRDSLLLGEAQEVLGKVLEAAPLNTSALNALGWTHRAAGSLDEAHTCFGRIVELEPANVGAHHALGLLARQRGDHETALQRFVHASELDPTSLSVRIERCHCLQHLGRYEDAALGFADILREWPRSRDAHLGLGYALRAAGKLDDAFIAFDEATADDDAHPNGAIEAGHLLLRLDRPDQAEQRFRLALQRAPTSGAALVGLSYALRRLGRSDEAETLLREAISIQLDHHGARLALVHILQSRHRLEEAAELALDVLAKEPDHADGLAALGNIRRRQGRRDEALALFRKAADADPANVARLIEVVTELHELGRLEECEAALDDVLAKTPASVPALMHRGLLLRRRLRRSEALAAFTDILRHEPDHAQAMVEAAVEQRALGRPDLARRWLEQALDSGQGDHLGALLALGELEMQGDSAKAALEIYRRAIAAHPTDLWARLGQARAQFAIGDQADALRSVAQARAQFGELPEIAGVEAELLRQMRDWRGAAQVLDRALVASDVPHFWLWLQKVQVMILTGDHGGAAALLRQAPASDPVNAAHVAIVSGELAEAEFRHQDAIENFRRAVELNPGDPWAHYHLAHAALLHLDLDLARDSLGAFARVNRSALLLRGDSLGPMQNHVGQIVEEALIDDEALAALRAVGPSPEPTQFDALRRLIRDYPDYTPAALIGTIALRRHGHLARTSAGEAAFAPAIPRNIVQYWHDAPPDDIGDLLTSWRELNPAHRWTLFDDDQAHDFIAEQFGSDIVAGYELAKFAPQRADIFRLAFLVARGGVYAEADNRCMAPLDSFADAGATLVVHQDNDGALGTTFIAATAEHPVLVRALELAAAAMKHGDLDIAWLATGPGLLTRAFMQHWATSSGGLLQRTQVMDIGALQRVVGLRCPVRERPDSLHWRKTDKATPKTPREGSAAA